MNKLQEQLDIIGDSLIKQKNDLNEITAKANELNDMIERYNKNSMVMYDKVTSLACLFDIEFRCNRANGDLEIEGLSHFINNPFQQNDAEILNSDLSKYIDQINKLNLEYKLSDSLPNKEVIKGVKI